MDKKQNLNRKRVFGITQNFKYWLICILIGVIVLRLYFIFFFATERIVTQRLVLSFGLAVMTLIWFLENRDRRRLIRLNTDLLKAKQNLLKANINTIKTLVSTLEAKDHYTRGHCERVTDYALKIAQGLGLNQGFKDVLKNAASIHDIGKLGIKDNILNKPDKLNGQEWNVIRQHPRNGINILSVLDFLSREKEIILHHHERFDGEGYPDGLKENEIPLGARILAVADSFDAMNSARAYRKPFTKQKIIEQLERGKGTQFDPKIVDVFLKIIKHNDLWHEEDLPVHKHRRG